MSQNKSAQQPTQHALPFPFFASHPALHALHATSIFLFIAVFTLVLALYLLTLAPGVVGGDAGEHQFAVPILGIPHTTGYPLYVLVGKLWTLILPVGSLAWRMNLLSAVGGALAASTTALVVYKLPLHPRNSALEVAPFWAGAVVAGLTLAVGLTLWQWSIIAGVRSINVLFFALLTLEAIIWQQQLQRGDMRAAERTLRWLALTVGLSLTHHRTTIFYLPSLIGWIWWHDRNLIFQAKRLLILLVLAIAPLLLYAFIYVRGINNPPYTHEPITDLTSFWFLVGSGDSSGLFFSIDPVYLPARLAFTWRDLLSQLSLPGVILAGFGGLLLLWRQPKHFLFQGLLVLLLLIFTLDFEVVNLYEAPTWYLMPAYFIFAVWVGLGVNGITYYVLRTLFAPRAMRHSSLRRLPAGCCASLAQLLVAIIVTAILAYSLAWPNWRQIYSASVTPIDEWRQRLRGTQAQRLVESSLPEVEPDSIIWADWEQYTPVMYYKLINGMRPDVAVQNPLNRWPEKVAAARAARQEVYFARRTTDLIGTPFLSMVGPLIHLRTEPQYEIPDGILLLNADFEGELELIGYRAKRFPQDAPGGARAGDIIQLMLYWRIPHPVQWDYALSLRLLDYAGQQIYTRDVAHPVLSSYPTTLWTPGEVVGDFYELPFPPGTGPLTLHLLPYRTEGQGQWHNLTLTGPEPSQEGIFLGPFE